MAVDILSAALRAVSFVALFQAAGIAVFLALFSQRLSVCGPALRRIGIISAAVAIGFVLAQYGLEAARMGGDMASVLDGSLQGMALHSATGIALAWRLTGLVLIVAGFRIHAPAGMVLGITGVVLLMSAFTLTGHTAAHPERWALSLLLVSHLLIVAFWFGALAPLYLASQREPPAIASEITETFSRLAVWIVPVLFVAGVVLGVFILKSPAALRTVYGQLLLVKLASFALLMGLAALNRWRLGPAIKSGDPRIHRYFRSSLVMEYALIAGVLCLTAVLTSFYSPD